MLKQRRQKLIDNGQNPREIDMVKLEAEVNAEISSGSESEGENSSDEGSDAEGGGKEAGGAGGGGGGDAVDAGAPGLDDDDDDFELPPELQDKSASKVTKLKKKF